MKSNKMALIYTLEAHGKAEQMQMTLISIDLFGTNQNKMAQTYTLKQPTEYGLTAHKAT